MDVDALFDDWERAWSGRDVRAFEAVCADDVHYEGAARGLAPVWLDLRAAMRGVLEETTLADVVARAGST